MALVIANRVLETSTTSGTGSFTLLGATSGYQSFSSGIGNGNTTYYTAYDPVSYAWEIGVGTFTSPSTLARTTVLSNSAGNTSPISFTGNTLNIWGDYPAEKAVTTDTLAYPPAIGATTPNTGKFTTVQSTATTGTAPFIVASTTPVSNLSIGGNAATVTNGVYTTDTGTVTNTMLAGSIANAKLLNSAITINGTSISLGGSVSVGTVTSVSGTGTVSGLTLSGTVTGSGNLTLGGAITGFATSGANTDITSVTLTSGTISTAPSSSTDIVNKSYADSIASGINFHAAAQYATTAALPANTYNNGSSGVGATLTAAAVGTLTIDSYTLVIGDVGKRLLIKNEVTQANNGVYTLTQAGTALLPYILTRATDYDTSGAGTNEVDQGDLILVINGTVNANTSWVQQTPLPITIGTTAIVFIQFAAIQTYTAGTGLTLSTNQFSITNIGTAGTYGAAATVPVFTTNAQGQVTSVTDTAIAINGSAVTGNIAGNAANVTGTVAIGNGGTGQTSKTNAFDALSPTTTKGDLIAYDGTDNIRIPVGTDTYVLTADSTQASGLAWAAGGSGGGLTQAQALKLVSLRL